MTTSMVTAGLRSPAGEANPFGTVDFQLVAPTATNGLLYGNNEPITETVVSGEFSAPVKLLADAWWRVIIQTDAVRDQFTVLVPADPASTTLSALRELAQPAPSPVTQFIPLSQRGAPGGVATLDVNGLIAAGQLPPEAAAMTEWEIAETFSGPSNEAIITDFSPTMDPNTPITLDANTTYENVHFVCSSLHIPSSTTVVRNFIAECFNADLGIRFDEDGGTAIRRQLEHGRITAVGTATNGSGYELLLCDIVDNGDDAARLGRGRVPTSFVFCHFHNFKPPAAAHTDGIQVVTWPAADILVWGCSIEMAPAPGYVVPADAGFTAGVFWDPADVAIPADDPEPHRRGKLLIRRTKVSSVDNYSLVIDGMPDGSDTTPYVDFEQCMLLPGSTAVMNVANNATVTGRGNIDADGNPLSGVDILSGHGPALHTLARDLDVDMFTAPPADGDTLVYNAATKLWVPGTSSGTAFLPVVRPQYVKDGTIDPLPNTLGAWQIMNHFDGVTPFELVVPAAVGHWIEVSINAIRDPGTGTHFDVGVIVGGSIVRFLATGGNTPAADGDTGWYPQDLVHVSGVRGFSVEAGDLSGGTVTLALVVNANGTGKLFAVPGDTFYWQAVNLGPHN